MSFTIHIEEQDGFPIVTIADTLSGAEAEIYAFGGLLNAFRIPVANTLFNVIDGFSGREDVIKNITNGFKSAKLSPFVCRMHEGKYRFANKEYQVNKHRLNKHAIHGLVYDGLFGVTNTEISPRYARVYFCYQYEGTDKGYPFPYTIAISWKLETGNKLTVATTIMHTNPHPIPIADGWHPYFKLGGKVDDWQIQFDSRTQLEYDKALLPTGKKIKDERFVNGCLLQNIQLDNAFELENGALPAKCVLHNDTLQLTVEPNSSYPLLQLYIPEHRNSIAIENLSGAPDNFNNGIGLLLVAPGNPKTFTTSYKIALL
ncbi:MAG: aldose 1-epimerase [Sediminibacterium sp.]|nr:aldose 1-epimerase [Sediminibacterium sp.]